MLFIELGVHMRKFYVLSILLVLLSFLTMEVNTSKAEDCTVSTKIVGTSVEIVSSCLTEVRLNGIVVYPLVLAATTTPAVSNKPEACVFPTIPDYGLTEKHKINPETVLDKGCSVEFTGQASLLVTNQAADYQYVHRHPNLDDGYVYKDVIGRAVKGGYYPVYCVKADDPLWYQVVYDGVLAWIEIKGPKTGREFAKIVKPETLSVPVCKV